MKTLTKDKELDHLLEEDPKDQQVQEFHKRIFEENIQKQPMRKYRKLPMKKTLLSRLTLAMLFKVLGRGEENVHAVASCVSSSVVEWKFIIESHPPATKYTCTDS